jgi:hypothetical protein
MDETNEAESEAEQHVRGFLPDGTRRHAQAEPCCCDCRRCVDILLLEVPMSPKTTVASKTCAVDFMNHSISLGLT